MYKLKKMCDVDKSAKLKHSIAIGIELLMSIISIGVMIYYLCTDDPNHRVLPTLGSVFVFLVPIFIELVFKKRFPLFAHIIFTIYVFLAVFIGCAFNMHNFDNPYDEILHFIFGYVSCVLFFYVLIAWKDYKRQSTLFNTVAIFLLGMSIAPIWEIIEFTMDVLLAQTSLGFTTPEFMEQAAQAGYTGIALNIHRLMYGVPVWDTITDMTLHLGGSVLFCIQYLVARKIKRPIMLGYLEKDYFENREKYYDYIDEDAMTTQNSENLEDEITTDSDDNK